MSNLNKLNGWTGDSGYTSLTSAQSYLNSGTINMTSSSCGSSCGSKDGDVKPTPSSCGAGGQAIINDIFEHLNKHKLRPVISKVFSLDETGQAHALMENNTANGKVVVSV